MVDLSIVDDCIFNDFRPGCISWVLILDDPFAIIPDGGRCRLNVVKLLWVQQVESMIVCPHLLTDKSFCENAKIHMT